MPDGDGQAERAQAASERDATHRVRALFQAELVLVIICWALAGAAFLAWLLGASFSLVITLGAVGACCAPVALFLSWRMKRLYRAADAGIERKKERNREREERLRQLERLLTELQARTGAAPGAARQMQKTQKIPCAAGFANLGGEAWREMAERDATDLGPLFERSRAVAGHVAVAEILFVYAALQEDGTLEGTSGAGLRQIVDLTGAKLVILASPNPTERVHRAAALPGSGEQAANLVFTIDRNGDAFTAFFRDLFALMRDCGDMPAAWAQLEDRLAASGQGDAPQVLLIAEGAGA